jgi:hypothetical protein
MADNEISEDKLSDGFKIILKDHTQHSAKTKTAKGETDVCPNCGKVALVGNLGKKTSYLHRLCLNVSNEDPLIGEDGCIIPNPGKKGSSSKAQSE